MSTNTFSLDDYDCIGFDLDCTLAEYNVKEIMKLVYNLLVKFLVEVKRYPSELGEIAYEADETFLQKGLIMDLKKGNILKIDEKGVILKATHGTTVLDDQDIFFYYGRSRTLAPLREFVCNPLTAINTENEKLVRSNLDCFDTPCILLFARAVDMIDNKYKIRLQEYGVWNDILEGLYNLYSKEKYENGQSEFFEEIKRNPSNYYLQWDIQKIEWLKSLKSKKFIFLLTGSYIDFASFTASHCIGENWRDYFDVILCYARKPYFFFAGRPFYLIENNREEDTVEENCLKVNFIYSQGNWQELKSFVAKHLNKEDPKCLYIGDNLIQDVYSPVHYQCCDTVAVVKELIDEFDTSNIWGSYFEGSNVVTSYWNFLIQAHAKICVSDLSVFSRRPIDTRYLTLHGNEIKKTEKSNGYYSN